MALFTTPGASLGGIAGSAALARLLVVISGNSQGLLNSLGQATGGLQAFQSNANALGNTMTRSVTLPILAIGGAVVKMAGDFEAAMARVSGLTELTATQAADARQQILDMVASPEIIAGPKELADALYFAASAGLNDFPKAMKVVELSAKGASVGMGEASDISRILISALNAFEEQGLGAAEAMDVLTATIKAGTAEPDELAISLGRLLPIAAEVGLSFAEVGAQVAALTNIGVPTRVATTALRALFGQFLAPTELAKENLDKLGISYDELQSAVRAGPLVAFELLRNAAKGNNEVIRDMIPQIRALTAFFGLSDEKMQDSARAMQQVRDSAGALNKVLDEFVETPFFKFQNALNELQIAAIEFGAVILPLFVQFTSLLGDIGQGLQALSPDMKTVAVALLAIAAAAGPALKIFAALQSTSGVFLGSLASMTKGFFVLAAAATLATGSLLGFAKGEGSIMSFVLGAVAGFTALTVVLGLLRNVANAATNVINSLVLELVAGLTGGQIAAIAGGITLMIGLFVLAARAAGRVSQETKEFGQALKEAASTGQNFQQFFDDLRETVDGDVADEMIRIAQAAGLLGKMSVSEGFPQFLRAIGTELSGSLEKLEEFDASSGALINDTLRKAIPVLQEAAANGQDFGAALKRAGISSDEFNDSLDRFEFSDIAGGSAELAQQIDLYAKAYGNALKANKDFQINQAASIRAIGLEDESVAALADKYGTSYDFMKNKLAEFGTNAQSLADDTEQIFAQEAGLLDKRTGAVVGAATEMKEAEQEIVASRAESLASAVDFFGKVEDLAKASAETLVKASEKEAEAFVNFARNTRSLLERGLDPAALQRLVDEGPVAVGKFVDATDAQLKRYETNFAIAMAAGDAIVLNEGKHLEQKGDANIAGFVEAMLGNKNLTVSAMQEIINAMRAAVIAGDLKPAALPMIRGFADAIAANERLPKQKVGEIVTDLIDTIVDRPKFFQGGASNVQAWANGVAENLGLSQAQGRALVDTVLAQLEAGRVKAGQKGAATTISYAYGARQQTGVAGFVGQEIAGALAQGMQLEQGFFAIGQGVAASFLAGVNSMQGAAAAAGAGMSAALKDRVDSTMRGSPKYFTYYLGQELVNQLHDGMNSKGRLMRPIVLAGGGTGRSPTASMDYLARAHARNEHKPKFKRDRHQAVKLDSYLVGRAQRMNALRREDRP